MIYFDIVEVYYEHEAICLVMTFAQLKSDHLTALI